MVAGKDDNRIRVCVPQNREILEQSVRGTTVRAALRRTEAYHGIFRTVIDPDMPAEIAQVGMQRFTLVLREDVNLSQSGVQAIRNREVD